LASLIKNIPLDWIQAYSLTNNKETYYPLNWNNCYQTTNGLAAGNTKEEAIVQGICEVAERHNVDYFLQNIDKEPLRLVDIDSLDSDVCLELITNIQKNNIKLYLIDATLDLNISTIIACGIDQNPIHQALRIVYGYGCHTDPQKAIIRAITEYLQGREGVLQTLPGAVSEDFSYKGNWQFILSIDIEKYISQAKMISCHDLPDLSDNDLKNEALCLIDLFNKKGFEIIIADKTHPKIKIPVYRIFVPGLLPGTNFCTISQNDDLLVCQLYAQGGQGKKAKRYYEDHFNNIINNLNPMWHLLKEFRPDIDIMAKNLSPQSLPIESLVLHEDYLENNMASVYKNSLGAIIEKLKTTLE